MRIHVGSKNATKVDAVKHLFATSPLFALAEIVGVDVNVETFGHPRSLEQVVKGAIDRAQQAFVDCDLSVGIEGGMLEVPQTKTGYMEVAMCAIWDGERIALGGSPLYEWPIAVADGILNQGLDGSQALKQAGITTHEKIGTAQGGIHILSNSRMDRTELNRLAVMMALIQLEHPAHYGSR